MKGAMIRCVRCKGRKKMYKVQGAYSHTNSGGKEVDCPMCLGAGVTKNLASALEEIKAITSKKKSVNKKDKDFKDAQEENRSD